MDVVIFKPDSVYPRLQVRPSLIWEACCQAPRAAYPRARRVSASNSCRVLQRARLVPSIWPCIRWGLPSQPVPRTAGELLPHRFILTTQHEIELGSAVCFLLHLPSGFPAWSLTSILPFDVRTFLGPGESSAAMIFQTYPSHYLEDAY